MSFPSFDRGKPSNDCNVVFSGFPWGFPLGFSRGFLGISFVAVTLGFPQGFPQWAFNGFPQVFPELSSFDWGKPPMAFLVIFSGKSWGFLGWDSSKRFPSVFPTVSLFVKAYLKTELKTLRNICHHLALHRNATSP